MTRGADLFNGALLFVLSMLYVAVLFGVAWYGDRHVAALERYRAHIYSLALAVYCTSWTFYGAVGTAVSQGWSDLPIYLGPILLMVFGTGLLERIVTATRVQGITSIADFIASRYGKARSLGVLVTVMAVIGTLPYIALQLKAVSMSYDVMAGHEMPAHIPGIDTAFYVAAGLALFTILFGARRVDAREHRHGLMLAVAFESLIKLAAFVAVGVFALDVVGGVGGLMERVVNQPELSERFLPDAFPPDFFASTLLAFCAIFCLPRQFQVVAVEADNPGQLRLARWLFPGYLLVFSIFVPAIAVAGLMVLGDTPGSPDTYVLALPGALGQKGLALLTFIGGFSAATAMVIVALLALSTMVTNEIVLPLLLRVRERREMRGGFARKLLLVRALTIVFIMMAAWLWHRAIGATALAAIGLLSFAMAAQFAPALVVGVYWRRASRRGVLAGLLAGFVAWVDLLLLPSLSGEATSLLAALFGLPAQPGIAWGAPTALLLNAAVMTGVSIMDRQSLAEHLQASTFTGSVTRGLTGLRRRLSLTVADLEELASRFLGERNARRAMSDHLQRRSTIVERGEYADADTAQFTERLIAGAIGTASARMVLTSALRGKDADTEALLLLDETSQAVRFNRALLEATLDNITQGVSVVDADLRLVGWNRPYAELLDYPEGFLYVGRPVAELLRFNAERGFFDGGEKDSHVRKRLEFMRTGSSYRFERHRDDGQVLEIRGNPLPTGGFVTTYTDVTEYKKIEQALRESEANVLFYTDNAPAMLVYIDTSLRYHFANRAYCEYLGLPREQVIGKRVDDLLPAAEAQPRLEYMRRALAGERQDLETELRFADGRRQYSLGTYIPHRDERGEVIGLYAIFQDISPRREAELKLQEAKSLLETRVEQRTHELSEAVNALSIAKASADQANQTKTRFLAAASHDLLQPLNAATLFTSVLTQRAQSADPELAELARRVADSLAAAEDILGALLDISKLDAGALQPEIEVFAVNNLLGALQRQFAALAMERGLRLHVHGCSAVLCSDRRLLRRVLQNFLANALRYTPRGGKVLLGCRRRGDAIELGVWDTGPGVAAEHRLAIFEEFRRIEVGGMSRERGLGLGLAIADRIARMLDYPLSLESTPGRGSKFSIRVPTSDEPLPVVTPARVTRGQLQGLHVWCVDNEESILDGMAALLERWGCTVRGFACAEEFRSALLSDAPPSLILADYHLGGITNGLDLLQEAENRFGSGVPGIVITADRSDEVLRSVRTAGYSALSKPVKPAAMRAAMLAALNRIQLTA